MAGRARRGRPGGGLGRPPFLEEEEDELPKVEDDRVEE
jgi:hypothetical protein